MRGFPTSTTGAPSIAVSSIGVACAAALAAALLTLPASAAPARTAQPGAWGGTRSLPLVPLSRERARGTAPEQGLFRAGGERFSLVGVVWDDPDAELHGRVQVRTRSARTGRWSGWQDVGTHNADHGPDPGTAERDTRRARGATAPLWVGDSDGVDIRVRAAGAGGTGRGDTGARGGRTAVPDPPRPPLPAGLHLELVDPGEAPPPEGGPADAPGTGPHSEAARASSVANTDIAAFGATRIPELDKAATERELARLQGPSRGKPYIGPRPAIVTRLGWGADESLREPGFVYTKKLKAVFVHHTSSGDDYTCAEAPSVIRSIQRYHVESMGWRDIGYNFLVDKCGTLYEGRAGGAAKAVLGAHTAGFNSSSMGIAVIGSYGATKPPGAVVTALARLVAWKSGLYGADPRGTTYLTSGGGNLYPKGKKVRLNVISGHRDGFATDCPGASLYAELGTARSGAARYQGR
ncbi:peptidoglycan recognition protein [Streptomyces sp. NPDC007251]|uniref:peptidoglycan recognition protein family protein n=1 Tax=Streptomyces sp. NPDC007251 TaxID=3154483 RepID=UPI0033DBDA15